MSETTIALSAHDVTTDGVPVKVSKFIFHPTYHSEVDNNDIALIKLKHPVFFNDKINPVCLPTENDLGPLGSGAVVTGWGLRDSQRKGNII